MASSKLLKERIESIQDTMKITNAMYLISSSKLRKARQNYQNVLPYFTRMRDTISRVVPHLPDEPVHPFFHERDLENPKRAYIVLTADKGMAGAYNQNLLKFLREHAKEWHIDPHKIVVEGCSAGGHLAASLGVFWDEDFLAESQGLSASEHELLRPDGLLLCYPVITSGEFAHRGSFENLLGSRQEELGEKLSLEKQVTNKVPKTFIWHTFADQSVPVENSLLFVSALRRAGVPTEFHMYEKGAHGLALADKLTETNDGRAVQEECTSWIRLAHTWLESLFAGDVEDGLHAQGREW